MVNSLIRINCNDIQDFFKRWFQFLTPLHHMTIKEIDVLSCLCYHRFELSKKIQDNEILDKVLFSKDVKDQVLQELNIQLPYYQVIISKFKRRGIIKDGHINPKLMPNLTGTPENYNLLLNFEIKNG